MTEIKAWLWLTLVFFLVRGIPGVRDLPVFHWLRIVDIALVCVGLYIFGRKVWPHFK